MSNGSGNNNEITIVIRADGSAAVQGLNPVNAAIDKMKVTADGAKNSVAGTTAVINGLTTGAAQATTTINNVTVNLRNVTKEAQNANAGLLSFFRDAAVSANQGLEIAGKIYAISKATYDFAKSVAETEETRQVFQRYADSYGQSSDYILAVSKRAVAGQVSNNDLARASMRAMQLDVTKNAETMAKLWEIADAKADINGGNIVETFNQITEAIGKGQARMLMDLGLIPESMGRAADAEGLLLKKTELLSTVLIQGAADLKRLGQADSAADSFNRLEAAWSDLKDEGKQLLTIITPVVEVLTDLINKANSFLSIRSKFAGMNIAALSDARATLQSQVEARRISNQAHLDKYSVGNNSEEAYTGISPDDELIRSWQSEMREIDSLIEKQESLQKAYAKTGESVTSYGVKVAAATGASNAHKEAVEDLEKKFTAYSKAATKSFMMDLETNPNYVRNGSAVMTDVGKPKALEAVIPILNEATRAAGLFANTLTASDTALTKMASSAAADPLKWVRDLADSASAKLLPTLETAADYMQRMSDWQIPTISEKAIESVNAYASGLGAITVGYEAMKGAANKTKSQMNQWKKDDENKAFDEAFEKAKQQAEEFDRRMTLSLADATEAGLADGFTRGGNVAEKFAKGFGENMLRQLSSALSYGLTQAIFSGGGGNIIGYLSGQNNVVATNGGFRAADLLNPVSAVQKYLIGGSSASGGAANNASGGLLGTLLKPMAKNGKLLWNNIGSNLLTGAVAGFAVNRLFGSGGLFGGSVVHGQESFDSSADLNTQVGQAKTLRDELLKNTGITEETRRLLDDATFNYTWVRKTKSGNGITSKKTTTYLLEGSAAAQASINAIKDLQKKVEGEQAWRQYEIAQAGQLSNIEPLKMALTDIESLAKRVNDRVMSASDVSSLESQKAGLQQQLKTAQSQGSRGRFGFMAGYQIQTLQSQIASLEERIKAGSAYKLTEAERADILTQQMQAKSSLSTAIGTARNNAAGYILSNPLAADTLGAQALLRMANGDQAIGTNRDMISLMLPGIKQAGLAEYELQKQTLEAGDDPAKLAEVLKSRQSGMAKAIEAYEKMWKDAEAEANDQTLAIEEQAAAFERFQEIQTTLLNAKLQSLQLDQQLEQLEKEKKEKRADDLLSSIFTTVGEIRDQGGKEVLIAFTDTPDGRARLDEWLSIIEGSDPTTAAVIRKGFEAAQLPRLK